MSKPFQFKEFTIHQDRCAMKIGTDGVLLGAWSPIGHQPFSILDIGAGTGVISLMLAQRSRAEVIDAIEIDDAAYEQCTENFENSIWNDRLFCYHASLEEFAEEIDEQYDLIVSNPPFYSEDYKSEDTQRDLARFNEAMPFDHLIYSTSKLLSAQGVFAVIIPFKEQDHFIEMAKHHRLFPKQIVTIKGQPKAETKRSLIAFSFEETTTEVTSLVIETARHQYTKEDTDLTKDFYLKM